MCNITIISIFLVICVLLTLMFKEKDNFVFRQLVSAFGYYYRYQKLTLGEHIIQTSSLIIGLIGFSFLFSEYLLPNTFNMVQFVTILSMILVFILLKLLCMKIYFSCFYGIRSNNIINQYIRLISIAGILSFFTFILLKYTPEEIHIIWNILIIIFYIIISLSYCYLLFKYFYSRIELSLHFILYLCTLEILPVIVAQKALKEVLIFTF